MAERIWSTLDKIYLPVVLAVAVLLWIGIIMTVAFNVQLLKLGGQEGGVEGQVEALGPPTVVITIYGKELPGGKFGFGLSPDNVTAPGPTIKVKQGDVVELRFVNMGKLRHGLVITDRVSKVNPEVLFGAQIGSASNPIPPGGDGSVVFVADRPGEFFYQCPVSNHGPKGMWGKLIVEAPG
ncbi:MAG: multicopper oxidase domain-containing protein [Desulfurococcales archaeon]|nr:multicopper oxidase domain-containing protein [Desulfurococcales archaeon]